MLPGGGPGTIPGSPAIRAGLDAVAAFAPSALVVALGFNPSEEDPVGAFGVTKAGFEAAARLIGPSHPTIVIVQEGGYVCAALPRNLSAFLAAFEAFRCDLP